MSEEVELSAEIEIRVGEELTRQRATVEERTVLERPLVREVRGKLMSDGITRSLWSVPISVSNALRRHRERTAAEKRRQEL